MIFIFHGFHLRFVVRKIKKMFNRSNRIIIKQISRISHSSHEDRSRKVTQKVQAALESARTLATHYPYLSKINQSKLRKNVMNQSGSRWSPRQLDCRRGTETFFSSSILKISNILFDFPQQKMCLLFIST